MAWPIGGPRTWIPGETVTAGSHMNPHVRDALNVLKTGIDDNGVLIGAARRLYSRGESSAVGNTAATETDLMSFTLDPDTFDVDLRVIRVQGAGLFANTANANKRLKLFAGAGLVVDSGATTSQNTRWAVEAWIIRTAGTPSSQQISGSTLVVGTANIGTLTGAVRSAILTEDETGSILVRFRGDGTGAGDTGQFTMVVDVWGP